MELGQLTRMVKEDLAGRGIPIDNDTLGRRPQDLAHQIAWNLYHIAHGNKPIYPLQTDLMQRLGYVNADTLTEQGRDVHRGLDQSRYYERDGMDIL